MNVYTTSFSSRKTVTFSKFKHLRTIDTSEETDINELSRLF